MSCLTVSRLTVAATIPGLSAAEQEQGALEGAEGVDSAPHEAVGEGCEGLRDVQRAREAVDQTVETWVEKVDGQRGR